MNKFILVLKDHLPYTIFGALLASILVFPISRIPNIDSYHWFYIFHPLHLFLSAYTTTSVYKIYAKGTTNFLKLFLIGYFGSILIGTLSDSIIPYFSEVLLNMPYREIHIGFLEKFYFINSIVIIAILLAYIKPVRKISHGAHIFVSAFASIFHILMANNIISFSFKWFIGILGFISIAVLVPCSFGDLIFPMFFHKE